MKVTQPPTQQPTPVLPEWVTSQAAYKAAWDENILARYVTVAGGIVELTDSERQIIGTCSGCPEHAQPGPFHYDPTCSGYRMDSYVTSQATHWAQGHAEKCRAIPRPV